MALGFEGVILAIILATLAAIVYSLRVLVILERRIARVDLNVERITERVLVEESRIERALHIKPVSIGKVKKAATKKKAAKKAPKKKRTTKGR